MRMILKQYRRFFRKSPLVTLLASIVLAIGFAGSTLAYTIMLIMSSPRPLGLRSMQYSTVAEETGGGGSGPITWKAYEHLRESAGWPDPSLIPYAESVRITLRYNEIQREILVAGTPTGFFSEFTYGLDAGQDFSSSWKSENGERQVILSRHLAEGLFSVPSNALDHTVVLNGQTFRVIGIAVGSFSGLWSSTDAWVPPNQIVALDFGGLQTAPQRKGEERPPILDNPEVWQNVPIFYVLAGSRKISLENLKNKLGNLVRLPDNLPKHLHVTDGLSKDPILDLKIRFWARLGFLLSIALIFASGLNYCGLLLAQVPRHIEEVRLKRVLGASVLRIVVENMCGPVITVLLGFLIASCVAIAGMLLLDRSELHLMRAGGIVWRTSFVVLDVELAIASLFGIFIAILPSLRLLRDSGAPRMGYTSTANRKANLALYGIVAGQMASCILIWLIAVVIMRAVDSVSKVSLGFDSKRLSVIEIGPSSKGTPIQFSTGGNGEFPLATFTRQVIEDSQDKVSTLEYVSAASCAPLGQRMRNISFQRLDRDLPPRSIHFCSVSQGFFRSLGNQITEGRTFASNRFTGDVLEVVINRSLANELWRGEDPLNHVVRIEQPAWGLQFVAEVVGVAEDMRFSGLTSTPDATVFLPLRGNAFTLSFPLYFLAKGTGASALEIAAQKQAEISMPSLGVSNAYSVDEQLKQSFAEQKARVWFCTVGAGLVAIIAYIGLYGVLIHSVNSRRKEMAIRACFGASRWDLGKIIVRQALQCSGIAALIALLVWKPIALLTATSWLGKAELSWQSAVAVPLLCLTAAVGISLLPGAAAARISPGEILKQQ
jgi:hypothetical protein